KPQLRNSTPDNDGIIRHTLAPKNDHTEEEQPQDDGYQVKVTPSAFHFEIPSVTEWAAAEPAPEKSEPRNETSQNIVENTRNTDSHKTPEYVEEQLLKTKERILRLKELSMKLKSANGLQELESEPAYRRKQMALEDVPHSSESQVSRFTLSTEDGITEIRPNSSFLHDNVD